MAMTDAPSATDTRDEQGGTSVQTRTLDALNFFLADVRDGLGPYLAIYLLAVRGPAHGWNEATVGAVLTIAGIVGLISQTPAGSLIDRARNKPRIVMIAALLVTLSSISLPIVTGFTVVAITQSVAAVAGAVFAPAISAITLGLVGPKLFAKRVGRNEAFNHAGNAVSAALAGVLAWKFGPVVVFWLMGGLTVASIVTASRIDNGAIDNAVARGLDCEPDDDCEEPSGWKALIENKPLMIFAVTAFLFHLANAAMLTSVSQLLSRTVGKDQATSLTAACIVAAQLMMVPVAIVVGRNTEKWGTKPLFLVAFAFLAARGALYTVSNDPWWLVGVQALDGIGAGIFGALFPVVIADLTKRTGRFNVSQGAVASAQGLGAALSASLAGAIIVSAGYTAGFLTLAVVAGLGLALYFFAMPETKHRH
ncbi:putative MFS family arabinose efflux permease [Sphingomonas sp. PP-F2F-G114-C0414]|uniref:MFS transporter n=1 Tax=Sphingomonas sp. PP-F2F-G114-C0414 TaxID=2135662 RepID=UPI000F27EC9B|nr:MFS transporter [Sphingomonas sp. PP-F2F-G114-C0414]RMB35786.1 putative MFS family arabinose efflux permease [Sphingomonas sp. PP-F2F-G114-C0414]